MTTQYKLKIQKRISTAAIALGVLLVIYMISFENEPGAIPLALITGGAAGYFLSVFPGRNHQT